MPGPCPPGEAGPTYPGAELCLEPSRRRAQGKARLAGAEATAGAELLLFSCLLVLNPHIREDQAAQELLRKGTPNR